MWNMWMIHFKSFKQILLTPHKLKCQRPNFYIFFLRRNSHYIQNIFQHYCCSFNWLFVPHQLVFIGVCLHCYYDVTLQMSKLTGHTDPPAWCSGCSVNLILDITVIWGWGELGIGWQGWVNHYRKKESHDCLHPANYGRSQLILQACLGEAQPVEEVVHVGKVNSKVGQNVGEGQEANCHFFFAERRDTSIWGTAETAPDRQTNSEEEDDGRGKIETKDDDRWLIDVKLGGVRDLAQSALRNNWNWMRLL